MNKTPTIKIIVKHFRSKTIAKKEKYETMKETPTIKIIVKHLDHKQEPKTKINNSYV